MPPSRERNGEPAVARASAPPRAGLMDFDDGDDAATQMFEGQLPKQPRPNVEPQVPKKTTLRRNSAAIEDDIQARALLAGDTEEQRARGVGEATPRPRQSARDVTLERPSARPPPLPVEPVVTMPWVQPTARRSPRSAPSNDRAFQRTEAEVRPLPNAASSLPAGLFTASGEVLSPAPHGRKATSWLIALGAAVLGVASASTFALRNPRVALAASVLADGVKQNPAALTAELPRVSSARPQASALPPVAAPAPPPEAAESAYVPGTASWMAASAEPADAPTVPSTTTKTPTRPATAAPVRPAAPKVAASDPPKKAPPPADPVPKKKSGKEPSEDERRASEEAAKLAKKQLDDQL